MNTSETQGPSDTIEVMNTTLSPRILSRALTRDLPLFVVSASYGAHLRNFSERIIGTPFSRNFVLFDRGTAVIHRDNHEWYAETPTRWAKALDSPPTYNKIKETINNTARSMRQLESMQLSPSRTSLTELCQAIIQGVPGMIFAHWIPVYNEQELASYKPKDVRYFEDSRQSIEKFFGVAAETAYKFLQLLSEKHALSPELLKYASQRQLISLIKTSRIDISVLITRKNNQTLFVEDSLYIGKDIIPYLVSEGYILEQPKLYQAGVIRGSTACKGTAIGKVQIITSREQFAQFEAGNILVAPMTSPEYTPLLHKAKAIITDEGGMLSHAAIVSRELNKPCIVGAKDASYLLENFHEVKVDAERGTVTLL